MLKPGGRIVVLSVRTKMGLRESEAQAGGEREKALFEKAWKGAEANQPVRNIGAYERRETDYPKELARFGFREVNLDSITVLSYAPDNADVSDEVALEQIDYNRYSSISSVEKALRMAPDALTGEERTTLLQLINERYDARVAQYQRGEKLWDIAAQTVLVASGRK